MIFSICTNFKNKNFIKRSSDTDPKHIVYTLNFIHEISAQRLNQHKNNKKDKKEILFTYEMKLLIS